MSQLSFKGTIGSFIGMVLKNAFFTLLTLGVYFPWAKTDFRKYFWRNLEFDGHRFEFTGKGLDLFKSYVFIGIIYAVFIGAFGFLGSNPELGPFLIILQLVFFIGIMIMVPFALFGSFAYLLSHTKYRSLSFGVDRKQKGKFAKEFYIGGILTAITFYIYLPWLIVKLRKIKLGSSYFGNKKFSYNGDGGQLLGIYIKGIVLTGVTLGIYSFWMKAELLKYHAANTHFEGKSFDLDVTGGDIFLLTLLNIVLSVVTLGLAIPWLFIHNVTFFAKKVAYNGEIDYQEILEGAKDGTPSALGDSFADIFNLDLSF